MRVLHVIAEMGVGGAESLVAEMATLGNGYGWTSAVASAGGVRADELRAAGARCYDVEAYRHQRAGQRRQTHRAQVRQRQCQQIALVVDRRCAVVREGCEQRRELLRRQQEGQQQR